MGFDLKRRRRFAGAIAISAVLALAACLAASAAASTGGAFTPAAGPPPPSSPAGAPAGAPSAGALSLVAAETLPRKSFYFGYRFPRLTFTLGSTQPQNDIRVDVVNSVGEVAQTFYREDVAPNLPTSVRWDGTTAAGKPARNGQYSFRISSQSPAPAARKATPSTALSLSFTFYGYAFPILGRHDFGTGGARFGAGRSGHTHQGQDVMAECGRPLIAARGGRVQFAGYQYAAGNYVVIDGRGTPNDFMYAHLAEPSPLHTGDTVRTGQPIGIVGDTGDATACHLHFEIWAAPGWYEGGAPFDPLAELEKWDAYS
ncbi:MAG TPA: peptidoglycan DD-metalloendopeptidase family protein [Solirubrobacterales bacterium]|nr:peptidoglycan DD-metalloendopeptidase family protein [Solirubrobacterales bacterium]